MCYTNDPSVEKTAFKSKICVGKILTYITSILNYFIIIYYILK